MSKPEEATVIGTADFKRISAESIKRGYNRLPSDELLAELDPEGNHVLVFSMPHDHIAGDTDPEGGHMRTEWLVKLTGEDDPARIFLDMSWPNYNGLPRLRHVGNGEWVPVVPEPLDAVLAEQSKDTA